jgi:hypothetical protein
MVAMVMVTVTVTEVVTVIGMEMQTVASLTS